MKQLNIFTDKELKYAHKKTARTREETVNDYEAFLKKFERKKTTDDCYTPANVYNAVLEWLGKQIDLEGREIIRPFYPDKDYKKEVYPTGCIVVDNPPFSLLSEIKTFYQSNGISFFLFAPHLTLFAGQQEGINYILTANSIIFENGANICISFTSNLFKDIKLWASSELHQMIDKANKDNINKQKKSLPKYVYPANVVTVSRLDRIIKGGVDIKIYSDQCYRVATLIDQKRLDKAIFGAGYLISDSAAAELKAAELKAAGKKDKYIWKLYPSEKEIIKHLR